MASVTCVIIKLYLHFTVISGRSTSSCTYTCGSAAVRDVWWEGHCVCLLVQWTDAVICLTGSPVQFSVQFVTFTLLVTT